MLITRADGTSQGFEPGHIVIEKSHLFEETLQNNPHKKGLEIIRATLANT